MLEVKTSSKLLMNSLTINLYHGINLPEFVPMVQLHAPASIREFLLESKKKAPKVKNRRIVFFIDKHCFLHRQALVTKGLSEELLIH